MSSWDTPETPKPEVPQPVPPAPPQKPWNVRRFLFICIIIVVALFAVSAMLESLIRAIPAGKKAQNTPRETGVVTPGQLKGYDQANQFPPRPAPPTAAGQVLAGGPDDSGIPTPTPEQTQSMQGYDATGRPIPVPAGQQQAATGSSSRPSRRDEARQRRLDALKSSAVVFFAEDKQPEATPAPTSTVTPQEQTANLGIAPNQAQSAPFQGTWDQQKQNAAASQPLKKDAELYPFNSATGKTYLLHEGLLLEAVLTNRLNGEFTGPVDAMLTTNIYSLNHQELLIPQGTRFYGEATKVGSLDQSRLAVTFHRMFMPDGFSVSLDDPALDQAGAMGLHDKVNRHYLKLFGVSTAVGLLGGLAQVGNNASTLYDPQVAIRSGITSQTSQEATQILDRFLNTMPSIEIREGNRLRVRLMKDLQVPAWGNHTVDPTL